ncbi:uncharacterized protein LOC110989031 [Acanthaster planci]|uniref:Uncharacterized protein LOC110989031 n=1 Tax=Acanthaster planci TaxID=133434 RepID=A0A8B7ZUM3_ACAPL|nr:uncharacterized protein LOC110989031 [Acanthaster planci]XP_022108793.1 uncharacterized protein LOC110989031 [Acanthaster planci]
MAMEISNLVGLDSISSLDQDNNLLSARSNSSLSSTDDILSSNPSRKKKTNTLSRLRKLKKHGPTELQEKVEGLPSSSLVDIKDFTGNQLDKHINDNISEVPDKVQESKENADARVQGGIDEVSSLLSRERGTLEQKPLPSPHIKPRRIRPLDGIVDSLENREAPEKTKLNHGELESLMGPPPLASLTRITPLNGETGPNTVEKDTEAGFVRPQTDANSNSLVRRETGPSPRVKPRRFTNIEKGLNEDATITKEQSERDSVLSKESSLVRDEQTTNKTKLNESIFKPISSSFDHVSMLPPRDITSKTLSSDSDVQSPVLQRPDDKTLVEDIIIPATMATEQAIIPQASEIVQSEPAGFSNVRSKDTHSPDEVVNFDSESDTEDLIVVPDNSPGKTNKGTLENISSNVTESIGQEVRDVQSDLVDDVKGSRNSLRNMSNSLPPLDASTPARAETDRKASLQSTDSNGEDLIVSTFANKAEAEEVITPSQTKGEESVMTHISPVELAAELNSLSEDEMLRAYSKSVGVDTTLGDTNDVDKESVSLEHRHRSIVEESVNHAGLESGDQTEDIKASRKGHSSPAAVESPPSLPGSSSDLASFKPDDIEHSVAMSEPVLGSTSRSQLSDTSRSFMSTGALSTITTRTARNKTYLSGGASTSGSLLSREELERFFPDRKVKIFIATWNMCEGKVLPDNLEELLLPEDCVLVQDMYVVGTQESSSDGQEWEIRLQEILGPSHVLLHSATHGELRLVVFIRRDLIWFCSVVEDDTVSTRAFSMIKTKGAVAAGFTFFGTSFLFINSHFTAGDEQIKERISDYEKTIKDVQLPSKVPPTRKYNNLNTDVTSRFDCIFWCGDFNFRLVENRAKVENWAGKLRDGKEADYHILLQHDQLKKNMNKKTIFRGFHEGQIEFLPTYKYDIGGDVYDTSHKARVPSYTDRILYKSRRSAQVYNVLYNACNSIKVSDHRPVYAMYEVKIRPGKDDSLTSGGIFSRDVFNEANKRRTAKAAMAGTMSQKSSTVCSVM